MRFCATAFLLFVSLVLYAQDEPVSEKSVEYIPQPRQMVEQKAMVQDVDDCYNFNFYQGVKMQEQGEYEEALLWYRKALDCPEVAKNASFRRTIQTRITQCEEPLKKKEITPVKKTTVVRQTLDLDKKGRYHPSREFLRMDNPDCFNQTKTEADRAYSKGYWEDAASLYRAAKSCRDADQRSRQHMNDLIEKCRLAAEEELLKKEREAQRQARHAIASNRANDAQELLRTGNRSFAFRLSDFANTYIAPEGDDNPDCLQAMYDAWYYSPSLLSGDNAVSVPLCYNLANNFEERTPVRFARTGSRELLYVFSPSAHLLYSWNVEDFEMQEAIPVNPEFKSFDVSPDGRTLVFVGSNSLTLWQSNYRSYRIVTGSRPIFQFDPSGQFFHYYDATFQQIKTANISEIFASRKGYVQQRAEALRTRISGLGSDLKSFAFYQDSLWLGYSDTIRLLKRPEEGRAWRIQATWQLAEVPQGFSGFSEIKMWIDPQRHTVTFTDSREICIYDLPNGGASDLGRASTLPGRFLAKSDQYELIAGMVEDLNTGDNELVWYDSETLVPLFHSKTDWENINLLGEGSISTDGSWFGLIDDEGALKMWKLDESNNASINEFPEIDNLDISPDGQWLAIVTPDNISVSNADDPYQPVFKTQRSPTSTPEVIVGNHWMLFNHSIDSVILWDWFSDQQWQYQAPAANFQSMIAAIDEKNDRLAIGLASDSVIVYSLSERVILGTRRFEGEIQGLSFIPESDQLLVVQFLFGSGLNGGQVIPRIWDFTKEVNQKQIVRLQEKQVTAVELSEKGEWAAFSNGTSISVYALSNLADEQVKIRPFYERNIQTMAFHPDGKSLAVAYDGGYLVFWDLEEGKIRFVLPPVLSQVDMDVSKIRFANSGLSMRICTRSNLLIEYLLDPEQIRRTAQDEHRQLIAFKPEQIRDFELYLAMEYPGGFERMAASRDMPLIRAFFSFYEIQAKQSNNIDRVKAYCERAFDLFDQLDKNTQEVLRPQLLDIYQDYHWKLLLRSEFSKAEDLVGDIRELFPEATKVTLFAAHTDLLQGKLRDATKGYVDWTTGMLDSEQQLEDGLDFLQLGFLQFIEYGLMDESQLNCICNLFQNVISLYDVCQGQEANELPMSRETRMQWDIFQDILKANEIVNHREKIFLLKTAVGKAEELSRLYPNDQANWLLRTRLRLAEAYVELSEFETTALLAKVSLNNAIHLLEENGETDDSEKRYLALIDAYQHRGDYLYQAGRYDEAQEDYETAVDYYDLAESKLTTSEQENYNNQVLGPIYEAQAKIALLNKADNLASNKLDRANELLKDGINASVYGHLSLLRADTATAVSDYLAGIVDENQMGEVLSFIDLMAEAIPQDKKYYLNFKAVLLERVCRKNPDFERDAIQYFYALDKQNLMAARFQWDEVLTWSDTVLRCAERMTNPIDAPLVWRDRWLNAHINQAYYLLMAKGNDAGVLERSIQYSEKAIRFVENNYNSYENISFLRTNYAHALYLVGEKAKAIEQYKLFVDNGTRGFAIQQYDPWEILEKDFRDLTAEGIRIPDLPDLIQQLDPDKVFSAEQWSDMGVQEPPNE